MDILERLKAGVLISDGGMENMADLREGEVLEALNLTDPDRIRAIHAAYFAAGSDFVITNTFAANRDALAPTGCSVSSSVDAAVRIARAAADEAAAKYGRPCFVALDVGPLESGGKYNAFDQFKEQVTAGAANADFVILETFGDLTEMAEAARAVRESCSLPLFCSVTTEADGRSASGADASEAMRAMQAMGAAAAGLNCTLEPHEMLPILRRMLPVAHIPLIAQPNVSFADDGTTPNTNADAFARGMSEIAEAGVSVLGGCCGTTPAYIQALNEFLKRRRVKDV
jgi:5-methyltetrahydrofolate--homocysteine methyltransferase